MSNLISLNTFRSHKKATDFDLSVVIPCFNEAENLALLIEEIHEELSSLKISYEIVIVDDGSSDNTFELLDGLSLYDSRLSYIILKGNYGHQVALTTGLKHCRGKVAIAMDGDFQHPPKHLKNLYSIWKLTELDVIQTRRRDDHVKKDRLKKFLSKSFYKVMNFLFRCRLIEGGADFRLMGPRLLYDIKKASRSSFFHRGFCAKRKYQLGIYNFDVEERRFGYSKYNLSNQIRLAIMGVFEVLGLGEKYPANLIKVDHSLYFNEEKVKKVPSTNHQKVS